MMRIIMAILVIVVIIAAATGHEDTAESAGKWILSIIGAGIAIIVLGFIVVGIGSLTNKDDK